MKAALGLYRQARRQLRPTRAAWRNCQGALLQRLAEFRWRRHDPQRSHTLPAPLIVSLTSYPARFHALASSLKCLLSQSVKPDVVILWLAEGDAAALPASVRELEQAGLSIAHCADIGSYKKLVPTLLQWPEAFVATADDDVYYARTWLAELLAGWAPHEREIPCHRAHTITLAPNGSPAAYARWRFEAPAQSPSPLVFPTGVGGVLYPPGCLHPDVTREALFQTLCPTSDDAWFYWMARRRGWSFRRVSRRRFVCWPRTQDTALRHVNVARGNDEQIARLVANYGFPQCEPVVFERHALDPAW